MPELLLESSIFFDLALDIMFVISTDGQILDANKAAVDAYGYTRDELLSLTAADIRSPEERHAVSHQLSRSAAEGIRFEATHVRKNGEHFEVEVISRGIKIQGKTLLFSVVRDITERRRAEAAIRLSEDKFSKSFYASRDSININRCSDGLYIEVNEGFTRMSGYTAEDVIGRSSIEHGIWVDSADRERLVGELQKYGEVKSLEARFRKKDGSIMVGEMSATMIDINGDHCIISITRDITERKEMEKLNGALYQIAETANQANNLPDLYRALDKIIDGFIPHDECVISLYNEKESMIRFVYRSYEYSNMVMERTLKRGLTEYTIRTGQPVIADAQTLAELEEKGEAFNLGSPATDWLGVPLRTGGGRILGVLGLRNNFHNHYSHKHLEILTFVSAHIANAIERKIAEETLRESEERYRGILQQSTDAISLVDLETKRYLEVNGRWSQMLGITPEEALRLSVYETTGYEPETIDAIIEDIVAGRRIMPEFGKLKNKEGRLIEVEWTASLIQLAQKQTLLFVNRDLSEEQKLQRILGREVVLAADVQKNLLPEQFFNEKLTVETIYAPKHIVSGDFFDYAWSSDGSRFTGYILDISGHGVASSLQAVAISTYFRQTLNFNLKLAARLRRINQNVMRYFNDATYAAAIYFEIDFSRAVLSVASAGVYGFLTSAEEIGPVVKHGGSLLGISNSPDFSELSVPVKSGDAFYFMSDGIFDQIQNNEILNPSDYHATVKRLRELAERPERRDDCSAVCVQIYK
jgi:PAS domain S-box-containing protein